MFEIHSTTNGPIIVSDKRLISLADDDALIGLCVEDESIIGKLEEHVLQELRSATDDFIDATSAGINPPPTKMYSYISAVQMLWIFKNHRWVAYLDALADALEEQE